MACLADRSCPLLPACFVLLVTVLTVTAQNKTEVACSSDNCRGLENGHCSQGACECLPDFYDPGDRTCKQKIAPGGSCSGNRSDECVGNATCSSRICTCGSDYFANNGVCIPRIPAGQTCSSSVTDPKQCVDNAHCQGSACTCSSDLFNKGGACSARILLDGMCNSTISDGNQCVDNAECSSQPDGSGGHSCVCTNDHFANNSVCIPRSRAGHTCKSEAECVEHANCTVRATGHPLCTCTKGYPEQGSGLCGSNAVSAILCNYFVLLTALFMHVFIY